MDTPIASEVRPDLEKQMSTFAQSRVPPGKDAVANTIVDKLRGVAPAAAAMSYPFLLNGFHRAVSVLGGSLSTARIIGAVLCLFAAMAVPLFGLASAFRLTDASPSFLDLRARRLAYLSIGVPPFFVLTGVALGLLHLHVGDELVWIVGWLAACVYVWLGSESVPELAATRTISRLRVAHGVAAALVVSFVLFHLSNHLLGLVGPDLHASVMKVGRRVYRSPVVEPVLVGLMLFQVISGARLAWRWSGAPVDAYRVFQIGSGTYLAAFIVTHLNSALVSARTVHKIETDWSWASGSPTGLIHDAWNIRLVPHYAFGVFFILAHLCSGLRGVVIAHGMTATVANRLWTAGLIVSGLVSAAIMSGLCGVRI
jgi:type IV secretory pathway TrbD component